MYYQKQLLLQTISQYNILPVTSLCNTACIFCSHKQNPQGILSYALGNISFDDAAELISYLDKNRRIYIGESATRLIEGEPFCNPEFKQILKKIRMVYPTTPITITTNGTLLNDQWFQFLKEMEPIEINYSINCISLNNRKKIMGSNSSNTGYVLAKLAEHSLTFNGSIVAMNWLTGWQELNNTIQQIDEHHGAWVRVFVPGYTIMTQKQLKFPAGFLEELKKHLQHLRNEYSVPISLEPPLLDNLLPEVCGVIKNSPAACAGIKTGDIILQVGDLPVITRVDAFNTIKKIGNPKVEVSRDGSQISIQLLKKPGETSGLVMDYDISSLVIDDIEKVTRSKQRNVKWIMASRLGSPILRALFTKMQDIKVIQTENCFFRGSIGSAGLLTVEDFLIAFEGIRDQVSKDDVMVVPAIAFDHLGRDLTGRFYGEIEQKTGIQTVLYRP